MPITYEWDIEAIEEGDIVDHHHEDTIVEFNPEELKKLNNKTLHLVLVRDDNEGRWWSYVTFNCDKGWILPVVFFDAYDRPGPLVPSRFQKELDVAMNHRKNKGDENVSRS